MNIQIEELEDILDAILKGVQELLAAGETIPPEFQDQIANEINLLTQEIDTLYAQGQQQPLAPETPIEPSQNLQAPNEELPSDNIRLVWQLAAGNEDYFLDFLTNFPDPSFATLLNNPAQLEQIIQYLHENEPINNRGIEAKGIPKSDLNSSNVYGARYDFNSKQLLIRFNNGSVYSYDTPPQMYNLIVGGQASATTDDKKRPMRWWKGKSPSMGAAVWQHLRNAGVPYRRIS